MPSPAEPGGDGGDVDAPLGAEAHAEDAPLLLAEGDGDLDADDGAGIVDEAFEGVLPGGELPQVLTHRGDAGHPSVEDDVEGIEDPAEQPETEGALRLVHLLRHGPRVDPPADHF